MHYKVTHGKVSDGCSRTKALAKKKAARLRAAGKHKVRVSKVKTRSSC